MCDRIRWTRMQPVRELTCNPLDRDDQAQLRPPEIQRDQPSAWRRWPWRRSNSTVCFARPAGGSSRQSIGRPTARTKSTRPCN